MSYCIPILIENVDIVKKICFFMRPLLAEIGSFIFNAAKISPWFHIETQFPQIARNDVFEIVY